MHNASTSASEIASHAGRHDGTTMLVPPVGPLEARVTAPPSIDLDSCRAPPNATRF
jgi:hypothetical protein